MRCHIVPDDNELKQVNFKNTPYNTFINNCQIVFKMMKGSKIKFIKISWILKTKTSPKKVKKHD